MIALHALSQKIESKIKLRLVFVLYIIFYVSSLTLAQDRHEIKVYGIVNDSLSGESLIGVNVLFKGTQKGTITNFEGKYTLFVSPEKCVLVFSYIGYESKEIIIDSKQDQKIDISLKQTKAQIEAVEIRAQRNFFGNLEKGRSIQKISSNDIALETSNNVADVLLTRLSGIWASKTSGAPGDQVKIRIRGMSSLFASDDPLYVVDGVQIPNVNLKTLGVAHLNINDVENITVLKDASSTALYGYQGGNGVVIIDTKRGGGENEINFMTRQGIQRFTHYYDFMNTHDYLSSMDSSKKINDISIRSHYPPYNDSLESIDWQDEIFQTGVISEYQLSASGTQGKTNYYFSGNYYKHKGTVKGSSYNKYSFASNLGRKFGKHLNIELSLKYSFQENKNNLNNYMGNDLLYLGLNKPPCLNDIPDSIMYIVPLFDTVIRVYEDYDPLMHKYSPEDYLESVYKEQDIHHYSAFLFLNYRITDHLNFNFSTSFSGRNQYYTSNIEEYYYKGPDYYLGSDENYYVFNHQYNLTYTKDFNNHSLKCVAGIKSYTDNVFWNVDSLDYPGKKGDLTFNMGDDLSKGTMAIHGVEGAVIRSITSYVAHVNYNYKQRYNVSLALNYDRLKEGNTVNLEEFFPSIALNWNIAHEPWFQKVWLNDLNLYVNYGISGNYPLNALSNELYYQRTYTYVSTNSEGYAIDQLANHYLRHEKVSELNTGLELSVLNRRITFHGDWFYKINSGLIIQRDIPPHYGGGKIFLNSGQINSTGIDLGLDAILISNSSFTWQVRMNVSMTNQRIERLDIQDTIIFFSDDMLFPEFRLICGGDLGDIYGYKYLGKYDPDNEPENMSQILVLDGGMFFDADTTTFTSRRIGKEDMVKIGNSIPALTWNLSSSFYYKNFSVDMSWYGAFGVQKYNATRAASIMAGTNSEINNLISDSLGIYGNTQFYNSSYFVEDASFARLKNLTFSYDIPNMLFKKVKVKVSFSIENLITITRYKGFDPESAIYTDNTFSDNAVDRGAYPSAKAYLFSIKLKL